MGAPIIRGLPRPADEPIGEIVYACTLYACWSAAWPRPLVHQFGQQVLEGCGESDGIAKSRFAQAVAHVGAQFRQLLDSTRPEIGEHRIVFHFVDHEIRQVDEFRTDTSLVKDKELALATNLIEALADEFQPDKYTDNYRDNLLKMIEAKKAGEEVVETPAPQESKVVDIMEALKASLAAAKKPPKAAEAPAQPQ